MLYRFGYDDQLYPIEARSFVFTTHSDAQIFIGVPNLIPDKEREY